MWVFWYLGYLLQLCQFSLEYPCTENALCTCSVAGKRELSMPGPIYKGYLAKLNDYSQISARIKFYLVPKVKV